MSKDKSGKWLYGEVMHCDLVVKFSIYGLFEMSHKLPFN